MVGDGSAARAGRERDEYCRLLGDAGSVYVIAEAGVNHNGDRETATDLIDAAVAAGADAVKFQTFEADRLVSPDAPQAAYQRETAPADSQREMLRQYELDRADHEFLQSYCHEQGIAFLSTPFDRASATLLDDLGVPVIKLGSGELTNHPLLAHVARFGRPILLSTGMGTLAEIEAALGRIRAVDPAASVALMHCTSAYPAPETAVNLAAMETIADAVSVPVGYSDHTTAVETLGFAAAAGAPVVEKHLTLDSDMPGPDHEASLEPDEFARAVELARAGATARGRAAKRPVGPERDNRYTVRKSLHAATDVSSGETITADDVAVLRPAAGLSPVLYEAVLGREATAGMAAGEPLTADDVAGSLPRADVPGRDAPAPGGDPQ